MAGVLCTVPQKGLHLGNPMRKRTSEGKQIALMTGLVNGGRPGLSPVSSLCRFRRICQTERLELVPGQGYGFPAAGVARGLLRYRPLSLEASESTVAPFPAFSPTQTLLGCLSAPWGQCNPSETPRTLPGGRAVKGRHRAFPSSGRTRRQDGPLFPLFFLLFFQA